MGVPVLLEAGALTVRRGRRTVLSGVGLTLDSGHAIHLAGANGSGKTSLLRVLAGLAAPRAGILRRHGTCAFVPEKVRLAPVLRCGEWLRSMRALRGLTATDWPAAAEASGLEPTVLDRPAATLSRGMLQRVALLEALHAGCPLLLLDEPFSGLDDERTGLEVMLVGAVSAGLTVVFLAYPLALVALGVPNVFKPPARGADVAAGVLAHRCCPAVGGTVGVLYAPPRLTRRATAIAAVLATLLALIAAASVLGPVGGPVAVASALSDDARPTAFGGAVLVACASCLVLGAGAVAAVDRWARRTG